MRVKTLPILYYTKYALAGVSPRHTRDMSHIMSIVRGSISVTSGFTVSLDEEKMKREVSVKRVDFLLGQ
jgi:hypothetical protein